MGIKNLNISDIKKSNFNWYLFYFRGDCFCGNTYNKYVTDSSCNVPCTGNSAQICGGISQNSIYKTTC